MFFNKKNKVKKNKCENCGFRCSIKYSFCPCCGNALTDLKKQKRDFGLLGKDDFSVIGEQYPAHDFGINGKLINSVFASLLKDFEKEFGEQSKDMEKLEGAEIRSFPNGIRIKISQPRFARKSKIKRKNFQNIMPNSEKMKKMASFPRETAKANVKRFGDAVVYELLTPGVTSPQDVFISKIESGYEIKAIGDKKVYVNNVQINLPLKRFSIFNDKLLVEFQGSG